MVVRMLVVLMIVLMVMMLLASFLIDRDGDDNNAGSKCTYVCVLEHVCVFMFNVKAQVQC